VRVVGFVEADVDGERVLLSPKDFTYFGIEGSGVCVWDLIDGRRSVDGIISELVSSFAAPESAIRSDSLQFIDSLVAAGLLAPLAG
jgi:hypothetical protein